MHGFVEHGFTMHALAPLLIATGAGIVLALGIIHIGYIFFSDKLLPRETALTARMQVVSPVLTRQTTIWHAWVGFNASHSLGAMLFGVLYIYLPLAQPELLFAPVFLLALGFVFLAALLALARAYWFSAPYRALWCAIAAYSVALGLH